MACRRSNHLIRTAVVLLAAAPAWGESVSYDRHVRPILAKHCLGCHGGVKQAAGLNLVWPDGALAGGDSGPAVDPRDPEASLLLERVGDPDDDFRMPPADHGRRLNDNEVATLRRWIAAGAEWEKPWAYRPPRDARPPAVGDASWPRSDLDHFVLARIETAGLEPSPPADRAAWLRRTAFDLTGMPPEKELANEFLNDVSDGSYERTVDRLLASPRFGERWASLWLDLARYADTMGYERDPPRDVWPYRDWVVRALNDDLPYDEFLVKQLAGDLLPDATLGDRLATTFHRNTSTNTEGGTDDEEFRLAAVVDRVDTTWQALLGLSFNCARCHDHPYDPISQTDYYRFYAFFNSTRDADLTIDWPKLAVPNDLTQWETAQRLDDEANELCRRKHRPAAELAGELEQWQTLRLLRAESTGKTELSLRRSEPIEGLPDAEGEATELAAGGVLSDQSTYTVKAARPASSAASGDVTALRIDALPKDLDRARLVPDSGFVLSRLTLEVERADGAVEEVYFADAIADEATPFFNPNDSLRDTTDGWAVYTRLRTPRWAVFLLDRPLTLGPDDRLSLKLKQNKATDRSDALILQRVRASLSTDPRWTELLADRERQEIQSRLVELLGEITAIEMTRVPVMQRRAERLARPTCRLHRGDWLDPREEVTPGLPRQIDSLPERAKPGEAARLTMARWIASDASPLTSRVMVNRVWSELFGAGIVETLDDFGSSGAEPSHPELLDWLAVRFHSDWRWSLKRLLREIVLSSTYRQDAHARPDRLAADPRNRLLARGPRGRLRAEMVRDQALVLSGRFNPQRFGPPVMPYQPDGIWRSVYSNARWEEDKDDARFRRALYIYWKRTAGYPSLVAFDTPSRNVCAARRTTTNTPLQALVTLNDPAYVELAEGFAERMLALEGASLEERLAWGYRQATGGDAPPESLAALRELHASAGEENPDPRFAMTLVASALMNLDAALTK